MYNDDITLYSHHKNAHDESFSHFAPLNNPEDNPEAIIMSLLHARIFSNGILIISDSRSTDNINGITHYNDHFTKLFYSSKHDLCIGSVGLNTFGNRKINEVIDEAENDESLSNAEDYIDRLNTTAFYYSTKYNICTTMVYGKLTSQLLGSRNPELKAFTFNEPNRPPVQHSSFTNAGDYISAGITWGRNLLEQFAAQKTEYNIDMYVKKCGSLFRDIISLDHKYTEYSFIGGDIRILKFTNEMTSAEFIIM